MYACKHSPLFSSTISYTHARRSGPPVETARRSRKSSSLALKTTITRRWKTRTSSASMIGTDEAELGFTAMKEFKPARSQIRHQMEGARVVWFYQCTASFGLRYLAHQIGEHGVAFPKHELRELMSQTHDRDAGARYVALAGGSATSGRRLCSMSDVTTA